jgi:hypothetical protein
MKPLFLLVFLGVLCGTSGAAPKLNVLMIAIDDMRPQLG